ncbi:hypothetical protein [Microlunatus flavus]|uniref:Uncharacterized protein n=1 Tax=Microlunatus flavus TaxID=1036181 RepID=A0A1H9F538_9ACTN|nr:hypothetical protein [Microlunatus flavus]SEQ32995.1 hypothetical protein SAMN05421756_103153 [Microlunatus flavus]
MRGHPPAAALAPLALLVALAGCAGARTDPPTTVPEVPDASTPAPLPSTPTPASPSATASALQTLPADRCLTGTWSLVRFVGAGDQTYGTGEGGDVTVHFGKGGYVVAGAGKQPITVTLAGRSAALTIDGSADGTFAARDTRANFVQRGADGTARLEAGGETQELRMGQVTGVVGLRGEGRVACTADAMTITLQSVRLELARG